MDGLPSRTPFERTRSSPALIRVVMLAVFSEFERELIKGRVRAGLARARADGVQFGRPILSPDRVERVEKALKDGQSIRALAKTTGTSTASVQRIKRSMATVEKDRPGSVTA